MLEKLQLALVTGAARRVGRAIALGLARQGYAIGLHYHLSEPEAFALAEELKAMQVPSLLLSGDLSDPLQVKAMFTRIAESPYKLQVLVNSAAVMARQDIMQATVEEWDSVMALNLRAPWLCAQEAAKLMQNSGGVIINMTDSGSSKVWTGFPFYIISKSGVETLTRLLARSLGPGIRVNAVAPGLVLRSPETSEEEWQRLINRTPLKRSVRLEEIVEAIIFLIRSDMITGQTLVIDGGYQLI